MNSHGRMLTCPHRAGAAEHPLADLHRRRHGVGVIGRQVEHDLVFVVTHVTVTITVSVTITIAIAPFIVAVAITLAVAIAPFTARVAITVAVAVTPAVVVHRPPSPSSPAAFIRPARALGLVRDVDPRTRGG